MTEQKGVFLTSVYMLLRFVPLGLAFVVMDLSAYQSEELSQISDRFLRLALVLVVWTMTEGVFMIWVRAKNTGASSASGYAVASAIFAIIVLAFLQVFRMQSSQSMFVALLATLALRGMSRAGWEQGRPHISLITSIVAHTMLGSLSFLTVTRSLPWQGAVVALALGSVLGSLDATWYGSALTVMKKRWTLPVYRVSLVAGPTIVGTLALMGFLPRIYLSTYIIMVFASSLIKHSSIMNAVPVERLRSAIGISLSFIVIMIVCGVYS